MVNKQIVWVDDFERRGNFQRAQAGSVTLDNEPRLYFKNYFRRLQR